LTRGRRYNQLHADNHRRTRKTDRATGAVTSYEWDSRQRLRRTRLPDGTVVTYFYDAFGRRVRKEIQPPDGTPSRVVRFLWDGHFLVAEQDSVRGERVFVHDPFTFELLLQSEKAGCFAHVIDPSGKTRELVDARGNVAWRPVYSAWGKVVRVERDDAYAKSDVSSPFRLLGHYWDEETGLAVALRRYFDPDTARWLSADPLGIVGGTNLFAFCGSPAMDVDPLGLDFTGTKYDSNGNLTPEYYAYLRARTPTQDLRNQVNTDVPTNEDGKPIDPITGQPVNRLEADHIVPMKEITQMEGFNQLSTEDQLDLLNLKDNFWGLGRSTNGSKSDQNHEEWKTYKGEELNEEQRALLMEKDEAARAALAEELEAKLAKGRQKTSGS
jgi:RHS repeat-associated protein